MRGHCPDDRDRRRLGGGRGDCRSAPAALAVRRKAGRRRASVGRGEGEPARAYQRVTIEDEGIAMSRVLDTDQHVTPPKDLWVKRMPAKYRDVAPQVVEL